MAHPSRRECAGAFQRVLLPGRGLARTPSGRSAANSGYETNAAVPADRGERFPHLRVARGDGRRLDARLREKQARIREEKDFLLRKGGLLPFGCVHLDAILSDPAPATSRSATRVRPPARKRSFPDLPGLSRSPGRRAGRAVRPGTRPAGSHGATTATCSRTVRSRHVAMLSLTRRKGPR